MKKNNKKLLDEITLQLKFLQRNVLTMLYKDITDAVKIYKTLNWKWGGKVIEDYMIEETIVDLIDTIIEFLPDILKRKQTVYNIGTGGLSLVFNYYPKDNNKWDIQLTFTPICTTYEGEAL